MESFVASFDSPPDELILDFDATDDRVHGNQEGRGLHGYYDHYCFLPRYVFCGEKLRVSYLRPSLIDGANAADAILQAAQRGRRGERLLGVGRFLAQGLQERIVPRV